MKTLVILMLLMSGCDGWWQVQAPKDDNCKEFDHYSQKEGKTIVCRMLWCQRMTGGDSPTGGVATLWCE